MGDWKHPEGKPYYYNAHHGRWMRRPRRGGRISAEEAVRFASSRAQSTQTEFERLNASAEAQRDALRNARAAAVTLRGRSKRDAKRAVQQAERLVRLTESRVRDAERRASEAAADLASAEQAHSAHLHEQALQADRRRARADEESLERQAERIDDMIQLAHELDWVDAPRFEAYVRLREQA
jgi:hypothetical protein